MTDKTKSLLYSQKPNNFRYSHSSSNSTENTEIDYNLYCFSQGYKNREKGYWRGVLRNKYVDFDLRFNKEWNRRIELEDDDITKTLEAFKKANELKSSNELISFVNDHDISWDSNGFQNFKNIQLKAGPKKIKNKEWLLSNGVKRGTGVELRTQNYKQFEASEKNKELKKTLMSQQSKPIDDKNKIQLYEYVGSKLTADKAHKSYKTASDTYNTLSSSANINEQKGLTSSAYNLSAQGKRIDTLGQNVSSGLPKKNLVTEYDQYKRQKIDKSIAGTTIGKDRDRNKGYDKSRKEVVQTKSVTQKSQIGKYGKSDLSTKGYGTGTEKEKPTGYGKTISIQKDMKQEYKYGQKGTPATNLYTKNY